MKRIVIVTATRAEYGLLQPLMVKLGHDSRFDLKVVVTGMHLSPEFGMTVREIEKDGIRIDKEIEILLSSDTPVSLSKSMGLALISFSEYFAECSPDALLVLGDRFETLAVCCAAVNARIPIFHLNGGETTEGVIDEVIRHAITKMSYLHFASTEKYRHRIIQLGEEPCRVFHVGAMGVENALHTELLSLDELEASIGFKLGKQYAVGTFHAVTLEDHTAAQQTQEMLNAVSNHADINYLFTKANADTDGRIINKLLSDYANGHENFVLVDSLGMKKYLSALRYASFIIGNSSSGLIEAPSFHIPTINIGDRQKGRVAGKTVIHCEPTLAAIDKAIAQVIDEKFRMSIQDAVNPYGDGNTSNRIIRIISDFLLNDKVDLKKKFYDIEFEA